MTDTYCVVRWKEKKGNDKLILTLFPSKKSPDAFVKGLFDRYEALNPIPQEEAKVVSKERTIATSKIKEESKQTEETSPVPKKYEVNLRPENESRAESKPVKPVAKEKVFGAKIGDSGIDLTKKISKYSNPLADLLLNVHYNFENRIKQSITREEFD